VKRRRRTILTAILAALVLAFAARVAPVTQTGAVRLAMLRMGYPVSAMLSRLEWHTPYEGDVSLGYYVPLTFVPYSKMIYNEPLDQWNVYSKSGWFYEAAFGHC
jgi:hypothetical protein